MYYIELSATYTPFFSCNPCRKEGWHFQNWRGIWFVFKSRANQVWFIL